MIRTLTFAAFFGLLLLASPVVQAESTPLPVFPGAVSDWHGYVKHDFEVDGRKVLVVSPKVAAPGLPWVWHGEFFGHKPAPDIALLGQGYHLAYMGVSDMFGAPTAVGYWDKFYAELTGKYGLSKKPSLVGLSRGGLYVYNWAIAHPDKVSCIYVDAPVCDFKSWPGGKGIGFGEGPGTSTEWAKLLKAYSFKDTAEAVAYTGNPVDNLAPLAKAKIPLLHIYGDADEVVPWQENSGKVIERYRALGGEIEVIAKPGVKHHPHGLEDSTPIVEFIVKHTK